MALARPRRRPDHGAGPTTAHSPFALHLYRRQWRTVTVASAGAEQRRAVRPVGPVRERSSRAGRGQDGGWRRSQRSASGQLRRSSVWPAGGPTRSPGGSGRAASDWREARGGRRVRRGGGGGGAGRRGSGADGVPGRCQRAAAGPGGLPPGQGVW
nr:hypothetical protein [Micromonospora parva]